MIPDKRYFKIGEASKIVGVEPYVLRYWESEFKEIAPSKFPSGHRLYKRREVEILIVIRDLLYKDRFTIEGARKRIRELLQKARNGGQLSLELVQGENKKNLQKIRTELEELLKQVGS